jgi:hypothetical protein
MGRMRAHAFIGLVCGRDPARRAAAEDKTMVVMLVYLVLAVIGEVAAFIIGTMIDRVVSDGWSMIIYMGLFFAVLFLMWPVAVWITEKYLPRYAT